MKPIKQTLVKMKSLSNRYERLHERKAIFEIGERVRSIKSVPIQDEERITEGDLDRLHEMIAKNHPKKDDFIERLYKKYSVNHKTHRIAIKDGAIELK